MRKAIKENQKNVHMGKKLEKRKKDGEEEKNKDKKFPLPQHQRQQLI